MQIKMHVSKKALEESFFSGWGFWHTNNSREDIFEQVRLLLYGYQKADLLCYRVKFSWKEGQSPDLLLSLVWETDSQPKASWHLRAKNPVELTM